MLEKAKLHFRQVVSGEGLQHLVVPEWGNATIYFKPMAALPIKIYSQLVTLAAQQTVEAFVDILILRGCDEQGQPLFKAVDKTEMLREISPVVVCDIIRQMSAAESPLTVEQAEKNS